MDMSKCKQCKSKAEMKLGTLPGQGYQVGFFNECVECGYVDWLLIDEDEFEVKFDDSECPRKRITFVLKGSIEARI